MASKNKKAQKKSSVEAPAVMDVQHGGNHYKGMGIQPVTYSLANELDCLQFSVVKYISRHKLKGHGVEDLKKCIHFAQMALRNDYGIESVTTFNDTKQVKGK